MQLRIQQYLTSYHLLLMAHHNARLAPATLCQLAWRTNFVYQTRPPTTPKKESAKRGRPVKNDIMKLQGSIPATPEKLARVILSTPPGKT